VIECQLVLNAVLSAIVRFYGQVESFMTTRPLLNSLLFFLLGGGVSFLVARTIYDKQKRETADQQALNDVKIEKLFEENKDAVTQEIVEVLKAAGVIPTPKVESAVRKSVEDLLPFLSVSRPGGSIGNPRIGRTKLAGAMQATPVAKVAKKPTIAEMLEFNQRYYAREEAEKVRKELKAEMEKDRKDSGGS
jgi:hypothetical protein